MSHINAGHAVTYAHTHRGGNVASSPELWFKMTQDLVGNSNQAFINATSDLVLGWEVKG